MRDEEQESLIRELKGKFSDVEEELKRTRQELSEANEQIQ